MRTKINFTVFMAVLLSMMALVWPASAENQSFTIADSSSSGTYAKTLSVIISVCSTEDFDIKSAKGISGGAPANLDALAKNKVNAAFMHSDVFQANAMADSSYAKFQTLVALYPEPIHILALRTSKTKKPGLTSWGNAEFNSLADTRGFKVGTAGGGVFTARALQGQGEGGFEVVQFEKGDEVIAALQNGEVAVALFVGAEPLPNIEKLNKSQYKLLPVGETIANRVSAWYRAANINYPGLTNGPLKTLAPMAVLLTRKYNTGAKVAPQLHFRQCFEDKLDQLKDEGSPQWQQVEKGDHGISAIPWYDIPTSSSAPARTDTEKVETVVPKRKK